MVLATSSVSTKETASILEIMINIHHTSFKELYPKASITPKMHFMLHIPDQIPNFVLQRAAWCMHFEAKHSTINGRNGENLPLSVVTVHQKIVCSKQMSGFKNKNENFLYAGDGVKGTFKRVLSATYPCISGDVRGVLPQNAEVYLAKKCSDPLA